MRKTKIICTIGPACEDEKTLTKMCNEGMDVARLNFSHGTHEEHQEKIDVIKKVREKLGLPIPIMLDTKGPEYRVRTFENGKIIIGIFRLHRLEFFFPRLVTFEDIRKFPLFVLGYIFSFQHNQKSQI